MPTRPVRISPHARLSLYATKPLILHSNVQSNGASAAKIYCHAFFRFRMVCTSSVETPPTLMPFTMVCVCGKVVFTFSKREML